MRCFQSLAFMRYLLMCLVCFWELLPSDPGSDKMNQSVGKNGHGHETLTLFKDQVKRPRGQQRPSCCAACNPRRRYTCGQQRFLQAETANAQKSPNGRPKVHKCDHRLCPLLIQPHLPNRLSTDSDRSTSVGSSCESPVDKHVLKICSVQISRDRVPYNTIRCTDHTDPNRLLWTQRSMDQYLCIDTTMSSRNREMIFSIGDSYYLHTLPPPAPP